MLFDLDQRLREPARRRDRHVERRRLRPAVPRRPGGALHGLELGLRLQFDPDAGHAARAAARPPGRLPRRAGTSHGHIDAYRLYRGDVGPSLRVSCSLKSIARLVGPRHRSRSTAAASTTCPNEALHAYASSDARLARVLTERRWASASRFVDRLSPPGPPRDRLARSSRALAAPLRLPATRPASPIRLSSSCAGGLRSVDVTPSTHSARASRTNGGRGSPSASSFSAMRWTGSATFSSQPPSGSRARTVRPSAGLSTFAPAPTGA